MAELPPAHHVVRADWHWVVGADATASTRMFMRYSGNPPSEGSLETACSDCALKIQNFIPELHPPTILFSALELTDLSSNTGARVQTPGYGAGSRAGETLAANTTVLVNYIVKRRYRGGKPRNYFPWGVGQDLATEQTWKGTFTTYAFEQLKNAIFGMLGVNVGEFQLSELVNVSYYHGKESYAHGDETRYRSKLREEPQVDTIAGFTVNAIPGSQRRRLRA